jgi:NADH-quinone oxidoreductase subunit E
MTALILQTFFLAVLAVGAGVVAGVLVKQWFGRRTVGSERLTDVMEAAAAEEEAVEEAARTAAPASEPAPTVAEVVLPAIEVEAIVPDVPEPPEVLTGPAAEVSAGLDRIAAADKVGDRPDYLPAPRDGVADNLRRIKGIGPQNEARLNFLGIYHIDQIASWTPSEVRWMGAYLSFPGRIEREDWIGQAKALIDEAQSAAGGTGA